MDPIVEWTHAQQRVIELVDSLSVRDAEATVPACPDWTVRDLFSHMVGLGVDVVAGDEPADHNPDWTANQVTMRKGATIADLVAEWQSVADPLRAWMADNGAGPLGDVVIHEQDLRGAVGIPGGGDSAGFAAIRDLALSLVAPGVAGLPPIALAGDTWGWTSAGAAKDAEVVVRASPFDLARALQSRRSADQLRAWTTRGDITPYLSAFATLGPLPTRDLVEA